MAHRPTRDPDMYAAMLTRLGLPTGVGLSTGVDDRVDELLPDTIWAERGWTAA